jgi:hypothetical protein
LLQQIFKEGKLKISFIILLFTIMNLNKIVHSDMTLEESLKGSKAPKEFLDSMIILDVEYYNFDEKLCKGQLVINRAVKQDLVDAFELIKKIKFPIEKVIPIVEYGWSDDRSMEDNNTSAFNYRFVANTTRLSNHSWGRAIDFNPVQNPAVYKDGSKAPKNSDYNTKAKGTLTEDHELVKFFKERGWRWGGDWTSLKDYQHFDKP